MRQYIDTLQDVQGNALVGATVLVQNYIGGGNASIFSDNGLTPILTSTVTTGADGQFGFFAADGDYNLVMSKNSTVFKTQSPVSIFDGTPQLTMVDSGAANAYLISSSALEKALRTGLRASFMAINANTGASTFSYNGLTPKPIVFPAIVAVVAGTIQVGGIYSLEYDGTNWQLRGGLSLSTPFYAVTPAETTAGVVPLAANQIWPEGDIRRYGALTTLADNSSAINNALAVSNAGGAPTFIPQGTWKHTSTLTPTGQASMYGLGTVSILSPQACDGITPGIGTFYSTAGGFSRFIRDLQIIGSNAASSANTAIKINFTAASGNRVAINFSGLSIVNFNTAFFLRGSWNSNISNCLAYNCYNGLFFFGQSARTTVKACSFLRGTVTGSGGAWGLSFQATAGENPQAIEIWGTDFFGYDYGCNAIQHLLVQIDDCSFSSCQQVGVSCTSTLGGFMFTNNWVEMQNSSAVTAVQIAAIGSANYEDIRVTGCHIVNDNPFAGSIGVDCANAQAGVVVNDNEISGFDIAVRNNSNGFICKWNRISIISSVYTSASCTVLLNNSPQDCEIGPNLVVPGTDVAATCANASANIGVPNSALFPVGTAVQFDASQNGFILGVTYWVLTSAANVLTLGPVAGGTAIAATGATAVGIFPAPVPVNVNSATPNGFTFYGRGAFIATVGGYAANLLAVVNWVSNGKEVTLAVNATITGTSAAASLSWTGTPAFLSPVTLKQMLAIVTNNGGIQYGYCQVAVGAGVAFGLAPSTLAGFTASGTKAINFQELRYSLS